MIHKHSLIQLFTTSIDFSRTILDLKSFPNTVKYREVRNFCGTCAQQLAFGIGKQWRFRRHFVKDWKKWSRAETNVSLFFSRRKRFSTASLSSWPRDFPTSHPLNSVASSLTAKLLLTTSLSLFSNPASTSLMLIISRIFRNTDIGGASSKCFVVRDLKDEVEALEQKEKEKQSYYSLEGGEMEEFREQVGNFLVECQVQVDELRSHVNELKGIFSELQGNLNHSNNSEIAIAEMRKKELLAIKENLEKILALNYQLQEQLTKQLLSTLMDQSQEKK